MCLATWKDSQKPVVAALQSPFGSPCNAHNGWFGGGLQKLARREFVLPGGFPNPKSTWCFVSAVCTQMGAPPVQPWCFQPLTCIYTHNTGIVSATRRKTNEHCWEKAGGKSRLLKSVQDVHPSDGRRLDWIAGGAVNTQNQNWHGIHEQPQQPDILAQTPHGL